jgi:hypothetical protein
LREGVGSWKRKKWEKENGKFVERFRSWSCEIFEAFSKLVWIISKLAKLLKKALQLCQTSKKHSNSVLKFYRIQRLSIIHKLQKPQLIPYFCAIILSPSPHQRLREYDNLQNYGKTITIENCLLIQ